jgi:protease I
MELNKCKAINLIHEQFEDLELWYPVLRLREAGLTVHIVGEKANYTYNGKHGVPAKSDLTYDEVKPEDYDALLVPGGWAPDKIRRFPSVINIVQKMNNQNKPIGEICHAGLVLISAGIIKGKKVTSTLGIKDDMVNAGGKWVDEEVVIDGNLISSRRPPDLPAYMKAFIQILEKA